MTINKTLSIIPLLLLFTGTAQAENSLLGGRVGAEDPVTLGEFYKKAFGMYEVNRFVFEDGGIEVMLNFGNNEANAKANKNAEIVLMPRPSDDISDTIPHLIFNVSDLHAMMASVKAAGGSMQTPEPIVIPAGNGQIMIAIAKDPAGNLLEMIQQP